MLETITQALQAGSSGIIALPLAFALGMLSAVASACCTLAGVGMLAAYSGTRERTDRRATFAAAAWFFIGTTSALVILGFVAGLIGRAAEEFLGRYWKLFAGMAAVVLGLAALKLLPVRLPERAEEGSPSAIRGTRSAALGGLILGGGVAAFSLPCNPGIFIVLGAAVLQGRALWGMLLMAAFALGFSLPLSAILLGVSFGKASIKAGKADAVIRTVAGVLLTGVGLYLLATF